MLLAIDIGNTSIKLGIFDDDKLKATWRLNTEVDRSADEYGILLLVLLQRQKLPTSKITEVALCSVVPPLVAIFQEMCQKYLGTSPLVIETGIKTGVRICVDNPRELGPDRVVNTVAAHYLCGKPVIIVDLGTAITFDIVSKEGNYLGGVIGPGINIASEALFAHTAMLPRVELTRPKQVIGSNSVSAIQSGMFFGYIGFIKNILQHIEEELGCKAKVIATGGHAYLVKEMPQIEIVNPHLSLIGLFLIYKMNKAKD
ncbi:MAG: type III pantothenate kinase [Dehalococcoidia bacterium]|nr:type III pantothenate kinase [Dehalococcoidia bacterium]